MGVKARYVFGEAWSIARSGPRQTAIAVLLVALALYVPSLLVLLAQNIARVTGSGEGAPAVVITLEESADSHAVAQRVASDARVGKVTIVSPAAALERFRRAYPDLGAALSDLQSAPFPPSLEVGLRATAPPGSGAEIAAAARPWPGVEAAESEEEYGRRFSDAVRLLRGAGVFLGGVLAAAAVLSVASAIRLALDLHREEIEIMRLMGATESAIRAPFWLHASVEGLAGGALALGLLSATYRGVTYALAVSPHPVLSQFWSAFLDVPTSAALPLLGAAAGFLGSLLSLGKKS
ncbi:MAG: cell division protein FtsX [Thermoanaerobaculia bacterium]